MHDNPELMGGYNYNLLYLLWVAFLRRGADTARCRVTFWKYKIGGFSMLWLIYLAAMATNDLELKGLRCVRALRDQ